MISLNCLFETNLKGYRKTVNGLRDPIIEHIFYILATSKTTVRRNYWKNELYKIMIPMINKKIETIKSNKLSKEEYLKEFNLDKILAGNYKAKMIILIKKAINHNKDIKFQYFENISKTPFEEIQEKLYMFFNKLSSHLADNKITTDLISEMVDNIILKGLI